MTTFHLIASQLFVFIVHSINLILLWFILSNLRFIIIFILILYFVLHEITDQSLSKYFCNIKPSPNLIELLIIIFLRYHELVVFWKSITILSTAFLIAINLLVHFYLRKTYSTIILIHQPQTKHIFFDILIGSWTLALWFFGFPAASH